MPRFSIKWLLIAVAFAALGTVALLNANGYWHSGLMNAVLALLATACAGMIYSAGERRAFCGGFFIFGIMYLSLATQWWKIEREWRLMPSEGLSMLHKKLFVPKSEVIPVGGSAGSGDVVTRGNRLADGTEQAMVIRPGREAFIGVGNSLFCFLFAWIGGWIARRMHRGRERDGWT